LNELLAALQGEPLHYWRDKAGHEVDFVLARRGRPPLAIECKWSAADLSIENLRAFRHRYPDGENVVVAQDADRSVTRSLGGIRVTVEPLRGLIRRLSAKPGR
jgi:predicted AAA+ superfamily ATPase